MYVKVLAVLAFVAVASAADLTVGVEGGNLIFDQNVTASPTIWKQTRNLTVNTSDSDQIISRVVVIDNRPDKDGEAKIVEGGEGQKNVTIELKGPAVFRGFDFSVQVFAIEENRATPYSPKATGLDTQNPQDLNVNKNQEPKKDNSDDVILGEPKPTAISTTEANKGQEKVSHPALVGQEQTRLNRDTKDQKINEQSTIATPVDPTPSADNETVQLNEDFRKTVHGIFADNSTVKTDDSSKVAQPVMPQYDGEDKIDLITDDDEDRKVRQTDKDSVPALPKEVKEDTTPKVELSSTTFKNNGQEKIVSKVVADTTENTSTEAGKVTTEHSKLFGNVQTTHDTELNVKGHSFGDHHAVPLPYVLETK